MTARIGAPALALVAALLAPRGVLAQTDQIQAFDTAKLAYDAGDHEEAVRRFGPLVDGGPHALTNAVLLVEARKYYAASLVLVGRGADAEEQYERLLLDSPNEDLSPSRWPINVLDLFREVKERHAAEIARRRRELALADERARLERERRIRAEILSKAVLYERSVVRRPLYQGFLPFGIAQFQNGQSTKGVVFLISETLMLGVNIASYWLSQPIADAGDDQVNYTLGDVFFAANVASLAAFAVLLGLGAWDGVANLETEEIVRRRLTPEEVRQAIEAGSGAEVRQ